MDDSGYVPVPRSLRVGGTVQIMGKRLPLRTAIVGAVLVLLWGVISFAGGDMFIAAQVLVALGALLSVAIETRWDGGYDTLTMLRNLLRLVREPRYLEWQAQQLEVVLDRVPTAQSSGQSVARPRWQATEERQRP